jgi:flagellar assembly protein FliH
MSSLSELQDRRSRVIRSSAATGLQVRMVPFTEDLAGDRPMLGVDPAIVGRAIEDGRRAGYEAGYASGLAVAAQSAAEGDARRAAEVNRAVSALMEAAVALRLQQSEQLVEVGDEVTAAAFEIATAVLDRELAIASDPGAEAIARALALAPEGDTVVRMNPADVETLGEVECGRELTVLADPSVETGGCIVEVGACRIDAQLSTALDRVRKALGQ